MAPDIGAAFDIGDAQRRAALQHVRPARAGLDGFFPENGGFVHTYPLSKFCAKVKRGGFRAAGGRSNYETARRAAAYVHGGEAKKHANRDPGSRGPQ